MLRTEGLTRTQKENLAVLLADPVHLDERERGLSGPQAAEIANGISAHAYRFDGDVPVYAGLQGAGEVNNLLARFAGEWAFDLPMAA